MLLFHSIPLGVSSGSKPGASNDTLMSGAEFQSFLPSLVLLTFPSHFLPAATFSVSWMIQRGQVPGSLFLPIPLATCES